VVVVGAAIGRPEPKQQLRSGRLIIAPMAKGLGPAINAGTGGVVVAKDEQGGVAGDEGRWGTGNDSVDQPIQSISRSRRFDPYWRNHIQLS
jgi:hypothetical protein